MSTRLCGGTRGEGWDARGRVMRADGWEHVTGDDGSGYDIGRSCLKAAVQASEGCGPATALLDLIMRAWRLDDPSDMFSRTYPRDKGAVVRLATFAFAAARATDIVAWGIVARAAHKLAMSACADSAAVLDCSRRGQELGQVSVVAHPSENAARHARHLADQVEEPRPVSGGTSASEGSIR